MPKSCHRRAVSSSPLQVAAIAWQALALALLGACGDGTPKTGGQVLAKVNGEEITIHQVNHVFSGNGAQAPGEPAKTERRVLDSLIDEQLLAATGKQHKLDRDPQVMQALDKARREILARAAAEYLTAGLPVPTEDEIAAFYKENPALFERRRVYILRQFSFEPSAFGAALRKELDGVKSPSDIAALLARHKVSFREQPSVRTAEQLPLEVLRKKSVIDKADVFVISAPAEVTVFYVVDLVEQPATLAQATPLIERYLLREKKQKQMDAKLKELRSNAKIEYVAALSEAAAPASPAISERDANSSGATSDDRLDAAGGSDHEHIGKGLLGTKQ
jgi:EpsD family peptidyl-prolyl cis-trans isomerase